MILWGLLFLGAALAVLGIAVTTEASRRLISLLNEAEEQR